MEQSVAVFFHHQFYGNQFLFLTRNLVFENKLCEMNEFYNIECTI